MSELPIPTNPQHRRQTFWQVWVPLIVAIVAAIGLAVIAALSVAGNAQSGAHWAGISLIAMIIPLMLMGLIAFAILGILIFTISRISRVLPYYSLQIYQLILRTAAVIRRWSDKSVEPILATQSWRAGMKALLRRIF